VAPITPSSYDYTFSHERLSQLRRALELTQAEMAELLDVPINTLSRWENGRTTPDAHALAAIYSIAVERDTTPEFFERRLSPLALRNERSNLIIAWDFQNIAVDADSLGIEIYWLNEFLDLMYPHIEEKNFVQQAYTSFSQGSAERILRNEGFQVQQLASNADSRLVADTRNLLRLNTGAAFTRYRTSKFTPEETAFILVSDDGDYTEFLTEITNQGVEAFLWATDEASQRLKNSVNADHFIHWDKPYVVGRCYKAICGLEGNQISPSQMGNTLKKALDDDGYGITPADSGFGRNNSYSSVLRWMERQGLVKVKRTGKGKSQMLRIIPLVDDVDD